MDFLLNSLTPEFAVTMLAALAAFASVLTVLLPTFMRDRTGTRVKSMAVEREKMRAQRLTDLQQKDRTSTRLRHKQRSALSQVVESLNLRKIFETEGDRDKLKMAGLRGQGPLMVFVFFKFAMPIVMFIGSAIYLFTIKDHGLPVLARIGMVPGAAYLGYYLPNLFLSNLISRRQQAVSQAFPDALDLLLICVQSGMSTEAAFGKVAKEISDSSIELAEEMHLTTAELAYLPERRLAFENLAKRTGIPMVKAVATSLIQAERYGTPVGQALRVMAKENRELRMAAAEKKAAALPPKLTVPMIVFFLPVLFLVILGPAVIQYMRLQEKQN